MCELRARKKSQALAPSKALSVKERGVQNLAQTQVAGANMRSTGVAGFVFSLTFLTGRIFEGKRVNGDESAKLSGSAG